MLWPYNLQPVVPDPFIEVKDLSTVPIDVFANALSILPIVIAIGVIALCFTKETYVHHKTVAR